MLYKIVRLHKFIYIYIYIDYCSNFKFKLGYVCLLDLHYLFYAECQIPCKLHNRGWNHYQEEQGKKERKYEGMICVSLPNS